MYLDRFDAANLAAVVLNLPEPEEDDDVDGVEDKFVNEYEMDLDTFAELLSKLLPLCAEGISPLTGKHYRGFAKDNCFILKTLASPQET